MSYLDGLFAGVSATEARGSKLANVALCCVCAGLAAACTRTAPSAIGGEKDPGSQAASTRSLPQPPRARLVVWDSDKGDAGKGWTHCNEDANCKSAVSREGGTGGAGSSDIAGVKWHVQGSGWVGMGWNWFAWTPETAGSNISPYGSLTFQVRVVSKSPESGPDAATITAALRSSNGKKDSATVSLQKYDAHFADGRWHRVVIPLADLRQGNGAAFDGTSAWELDLGHFSSASREFDVYVDDIAAEM
jgi:hypothetical protein